MQINTQVIVDFIVFLQIRQIVKINLLNDKELNIKVGAQVLKDKYNSYKVEEHLVVRHIVKTYSGWEAALRGYNGWGCTGDNNYVENVKSKYFELVRLYNGGRFYFNRLQEQYYFQNK